MGQKFKDHANTGRKATKTPRNMSVLTDLGCVPFVRGVLQTFRSYGPFEIFGLRGYGGVG